MKSKKNIYILIVLVVLIWGAIIYQFFSYANPETIDGVQNATTVKPLVLKKKDTSSIDVAYRDPFLGKMYLEDQEDSAKKKNTGKRRLIQAEELIWPNISYKGIVSDAKDKNVVYMLMIDGNTFLMRKGNVEGGVLLKSGDRESVLVKYEGRLNVILIEE